MLGSVNKLFRSQNFVDKAQQCFTFTPCSSQNSNVDNICWILTRVHHSTKIYLDLKDFRNRSEILNNFEIILLCGLCSVSATVYKSNTCGKMSLWNEFFLSEKFCQNATGSKMPPLWTLGVTDKNVLQRYRQTLMILIVHKNELFALEIKSPEHYFINVIQNIHVHEP